jgi:serine/threonine protein kinase
MREQPGQIMQEESLPRFGNYDLVRRIDVGGMGEVYLAHQRSAFGRAVAIKIIRSDLVHDMTARARFLREAEVSAHLKHEHILPLFEFGEDQGRLFLVTPYIEGGTLARHLQSGPLSLTEVHHLFVPLVQAVAYIHRRGVIHRDLKPTNILLDEQDGELYVRLIDFGIASVQGSAASPPLTTAGNELGTIAYMAPERLSGVAAPSNDIYSLGIILYQMLTGHIPVGEDASDLPQPLEYVVRRSIANRPEDRFATAEGVLNNFERAYRDLMTSSQIPPSASPASPGNFPSRHLSSALNRPPNALPGNEVDASEQELVALQHTGSMPVVEPLQPQGAFSREDYNAPTTRFDPFKQQGQQPAGGRPHPRKAPSSGKRRSLLPLLSAITVMLLLAIVGIGYYAIQAVTATAVTINLSPQTHVISQIYTITADPLVQTPNVGTMSIPARAFYSTKHSSQTGPTTGQVNCVLGVFQCQQGVSQDDVNNLVNQMQPDLENTITRELQQKIANARGLKISSINFQIVSIKSNPGINEVGKAVTVTLEEKGSAGYILNNDAQNMAQQLVTQQAQQYGQNYMLLHSSITTGAPVVEGVDSSGIITINIAAGCIVEFQFPASELQAMRDHLKSRTLKDATNYLANQQGVDSTTVGIHFTRGKSNTLPGDPQYITIAPINPASLPPVQLQSVPTPTYTPSTDGGADLTPTPVATLSPTPSATPTNN